MTMTTTTTTVAIPPSTTGLLAAATSSKSVTQDLSIIEKRYAANGIPQLPVVIARAQGAHYYDVEGRKYIDLLSSFSAINQGHCHPKLVQTMSEQGARCFLSSQAFHNDQYPLLCEKLCKLFELDRASAMNSGAEAMDLAIKLSRKWGYRVKGIPRDEALVLTCDGNYHGRTLGPLSGTLEEAIRKDYGPFLPGMGPDCAGPLVRFNQIQDLQDALEKSGPKIAAFIVEVVQGHSGCIPSRDGFIEAAFRLCKQHNVLFVVDEVQCGLGRAGFLRTYAPHNAKPDLVVLGKALTGGAYPLSVVLGTEEVMGQMLPGEQTSTFGCNPLGSALAMTALDILLEEELCERSLRLGEQLKTRLQAIMSPVIISVDGQGLFCSMLIDESHPSGRVTARRLAELLMGRGVLTSAADSRIRVAPPLCIKEEDLWHAVTQIELCIHELTGAQQV